MLFRSHGSIECFNGQWYVFYHRCSRGVQQHRRLCIEPIKINPDGTIDEVKMTSQGAGAPFAPGETIYGYQACGLNGTVYIGADDNTDTYNEKLTNISPGDEIIFRYVRNDAPWSEIVCACSGSGRLQILLDDTAAGAIEIAGKTGRIRTETAGISMPAGERELKLKVEASDGLEIVLK